MQRVTWSSINTDTPVNSFEGTRHSFISKRGSLVGDRETEKQRNREREKRFIQFPDRDKHLTLIIFMTISHSSEYHFPAPAPEDPHFKMTLKIPVVGSGCCPPSLGIIELHVRVINTDQVEIFTAGGISCPPESSFCLYL